MCYPNIVKLNMVGLTVTIDNWWKRNSGTFTHLYVQNTIELALLDDMH